jgi:hypothetical protein
MRAGILSPNPARRETVGDGLAGVRVLERAEQDLGVPTAHARLAASPVQFDEQPIAIRRGAIA